MASELPNCCVGVYAYLRCILRHCDVQVYASCLRTRALHQGFLLSHLL